jgi:peptidoglycan hydrolase-like amidase
MFKTTLKLFTITLLLTLFIKPSLADELLDVQNQINKKNSELSATQASLEKIKKDIAALGTSLAGTQSELDLANAQVEVVRQELVKAEEILVKKRDTLAYLVEIRNKQIRQLYENPGRTPFELFLGNSDLTGFSENLAYQSQVIGDSRKLIKLVNSEVSLMEKTRNDIQASKNEIEALATSISARLAALKNDYNSASSRQSYLNTQTVRIKSSLNGLTAKQNQLIAERLAQFNQNQTLGSGTPGSTPLPNPGFSPAYAVAAYGYPHRVGMNQYGAYGRAKAGQDYQTILKSYYAGIAVGAYGVPATIDVQGYGTLSFEDHYLLGISEMPRSWPIEALKAQAVAARTYAIKWVQSNPGGAICTTQSCQVFNPNQVNQSDNWYQAVQATRGIVATYNGAPINAWYSSTNGGYTLSSQAVWGGATPYATGIKDVAPGGSWPTDSYDGPKYGNSPWFHKAWGNKACSGSNNPWMTRDEVADLFNSLLLSEKDSSQTSALNPPDCGRGGISFQEVKNRLAARGVANVGDIGNIVAGFDNKGNTVTLNVISSNYGLIVFDAQKFRSIYLLRSLGSLTLPTTLFDFIICPPTCS